MKPEWGATGDLSLDSHGLLPAQNGNEADWINRDGVLKIRAPDRLKPVSGFSTNGLAVGSDANKHEGGVHPLGVVVIVPERQNIDKGLRVTSTQDARHRDAC